MVDKQRILIVDDDENIAELISLYLMKECYDTKIVGDGESALKEVPVFKPNLILLDLMLPGMDGWTVLEKLRSESTVPVIMLTAKGDTLDRIQGLELGADDYIPKPFEAKELLARIRAVLRRSATPGDEKELRFPGLTISLDNYTVTLDGKQLDMPPKEIELLFFLASREGKVFTREQLLEQVWAFDFFGDSRTVDVHIKRIREKIGERPEWEIKTVWGVGYKFETAK